jgi:triphosphoribosyl-dephospho-CoA synthase
MFLANKLAIAKPIPLDLSPDPETQSAWLANEAVSALIDEATLTPKPALVDHRGSGAHHDLDLPLMLLSAASLRPTFTRMAKAAERKTVGQELREQLACIGRHGETEMMAATGGSNSHRGAIWALGLLIAGAVLDGQPDAAGIAGRAAAIARHPDRYAPQTFSNGKRVSNKYGVGGARAEAEEGFPHAVTIGLPALREARGKGMPETAARIVALLSIMTSLNDTCLLHRGGLVALETARNGARAVLTAGGITTRAGMEAFERLERELLALNASPGGSADLLAVTLFLDRLDAPKAPQSGSSCSWR